MDVTKATDFLEALLNQKLRVYTNDSRIFVGDFKCTDNVSPTCSHDGVSRRLNFNFYSGVQYHTFSVFRVPPAFAERFQSCD